MSTAYTELADALYQARKDYLDAMERSDVQERLRKRDVFATLLWDNKATFELALRAAVQRDDWQSVETAPKDGTAVWLWCQGEAYLGYYDTSHWRGEGEGKWFLKGGVHKKTGQPDSVFGTHVVGAEPTLWHPLPAPPRSPANSADTQV